jgi:hypothetical protein
MPGKLKTKGYVLLQNINISDDKSIRIVETWPDNDIFSRSVFLELYTEFRGGSSYSNTNTVILVETGASITCNLP